MPVYDPFDPRTIDDPYAAYAWLRSNAPAYRNPDHNIWVLSRFADVNAALRDYETYSSEQGVGSDYRPVPMMIANDPPEHARLRRIVQRDFVPKAIEHWRPRIEVLVDELLGRALASDGPVDWIDQVAMPLPVWVIADMLGVPRGDRDAIKAWSDDTLTALGGRLDLETSARVETNILRFTEYLYGQINGHRATPSDDLISTMLAPRSGEVLTDDELVSFAALLVVAGNETTTNLFGSFVQLMIEYPEQWETLRARPDLIPNAVEETLRFESPIQGFFRTTTREVALHGETIPTNAKVMMLYGAANRDDAAFAGAGRFDVRREVSNHLAFGSGIHLCLGAPVARLEATVLIRALIDRVERFEPVGEMERTSNPLLRGVRRLPVRLIPA
jgi:cytochrome P450